MRLVPAGYPGWADRWVRAGWRVQERGGVARLLDPHDRVVAEDAIDACIAAGKRHAPSARHTRAAILLHGLGRTRRSMTPMARALTEGGWAVAAIGYPSLTQPFEAHVEAIRGIAEALIEDGAREISVVGHSLGGLITRAALAKGWPAGRAVLLGTPNRGAVIAERLHRFPPYRAIFGPCGQTVRPGNVRAIPIPPTETLVIAGGTGGRGFNPLLPSDNDSIVTVTETRLAGADFRLVRCLHYRLPAHPAVIAATLEFLNRKTAAALAA